MTVLVFNGGSQTAISTVAACARPRTSRRRLRFVGPVSLDGSVRRHISRVIIPIVDRFCEELELPLRAFTLSVANLDFASALDIPLTVSGYSADAPIFLSLLSAALGLPLPKDVLSTGHISSMTGRIGPVGRLREKLDCATKDTATRRFICPALTESLADVAPRSRSELGEAIAQSRRSVSIETVRDICDLLKAVCEDTAISLASLRSGFFGRDVTNPSSDSPVDRAIAFFTRDNDSRFWSSVENACLSRRYDDAKELLAERARFHSLREEYPSGMGRTLRRLIVSLPPHIRRDRSLFPLLSMGAVIELSRFAREPDHEDVVLLQEASRGAGVDDHGAAPSLPRSAGAGDDEADETLNALLRRIDSVALAGAITSRVDSARLAFSLDSATIDGDGAFFDIIESFYLHLCRHLSGGGALEAEDKLRDDAHALLDDAYRKHGGVTAAIAEGRQAVHGGMRRVLDEMTERYKNVRTRNRVRAVLKESLAGMDWEGKLSLAHILLERLGPALPEADQQETAERCAHHVEELVESYAASMDEMKGRLSAL